MTRGLPLPRPSRFLFLAAALVALAVLVVGDGVPPAQAQSATVLVSNLGQTANTSSLGTNNIVWAVRFDTGSDPAGYALTSVAVVIGASPTESQRDTIRAELWSDNSGPDSKVYDLTVPAHPISAGTVTFTAPANATLSPDTTYWVVPYTTGNFNLLMGNTDSDGEDSGAAAGWSIGNASRFRQSNSPTGGPWGSQTVNTPVLRVQVNGPADDPLALSGLTAESSTDGSNFADLTLSPEFDAETTGYAAGVENDVTHVRLTPTLADTNSSVKVGKSSGTLTTVASGSASGAIALENGENQITVEVTDSGGTTKNYTVNVIRGTVWSARLTPKDIGTFGIGCHNNSIVSSNECRNSLNDVDFTVGGTNYGVFRLTVSSSGGSNVLILTLSPAPDDSHAVKALNFCVGSTPFALSAHDNRSAAWTNSGLTWTAGAPVSLSIGTSCSQQAADPLALSDLTAEGSTDGSNFAALADAQALAPAFDADTTVYRATVGNDTTHVRLTSTLADTNSTVQVGRSGGTLATVASGSPSGAIALAVGDNEITVRVTDTGSNTKDYTVTVRRVPTGSEWWATLVPAEVTVNSTAAVGCHDTGTTSCDSLLTDDDFTVGGTASSLVTVGDLVDPYFQVNLAATPSTSLAFLRFCAGDTGFPITASTSAVGESVDAGWTAGVPVSLSIGAICTQPADLLVSSMGQAPGSATFTTDTAVSMQGFTTGSHSAGYTLTSIDAAIQASNISSGQRNTIRAELWSAATGGGPGSKVRDLTVPASVSAGTVTFPAPANTTLSAGTKYFFVLYTTGGFDLEVGGTDSNDEDPVSLAGWSIEDTYWYVAANTPSGATWTKIPVTDSASNSYRFRVRGAEAAQQTLSSNANLSNLAASSATSAGGTYSSVTLSPAFAAGTTSYTATVANARSHAKLTPTVADSNATVQVGKSGSLASVSSGNPSAAITLDVGANAITVRVTAQDSTTRDYTVTITRQGAVQQTPTVSLSATPNPVAEGQSVTVRATLSASLSSSVTIPLAITDGTAEPADHGTLANIVIAGGATFGTGTIATNHDSDDVDETFTVALGTLPSSVTAGSPSSVGITIRDDEALPKVRLSVTPNPAPEGSRVSIGAIMSKPVGRDVSIRVQLLWGQGVENGQVVEYGTLDQGDLEGGMLGKVRITEHNGKKYAAHVFPTLVRVNSVHGGMSGTLNVSLGGGAGAGEDFTVRLDTNHPDWPSGVAAGDPSSVKVAVKEADPPRQDGGTPRQGDAPAWPLSGIQVCWDDEAAVGDDNCLPATPASYGYRVRVDSSATHVTVAPTLAPERRNASLALSKVTYNNGVARVSYGTVSSGKPSAAIALNRGNTNIRVRVSGYGPLSTITLSVQGSAGGGQTQGSDGGSPQPTAVTLSLNEATVSESTGDVTLTATLDAPAPEGGMGGFLFAGEDGTASGDIDFTMPLGIFIPGGQRSATATISITDDDLDEADETVALSALFDMGTALLEDKITLTITDDDTAGVTVSAAGRLAVDEGGSATYTVVLDSQPTGDVTITASSSDTDAVAVSPASHTFTPSGWNTAKTFTVSGVADTDGDDESVAISHGVTSDDAKYGAVVPAAVSVAVSETTTEQQSPQDKYASLIAKMKQWRDDPCCASNKDHTDRWDKALLAFGESVADASLTPMTATEAQGYADRGWTRWVEVAAALRDLENQAPTVASAISDATIVSESGTHQVSLSGVFSDADNNTLTITAASDDEAVATVSVAPDYSTLTVSAKARGTAEITVTANDGNGGTVSDTFTVTVKAAPVVASAISDVSGLEVGDTQDVSLAGVFSDADGDALTITAASSDNAVATVSVAADQSKLTLTGVAQGTATITVTARDSDGNTVSDAFDVSVSAPQQQQDPANQAPTVASASAIADATIVNESGTHQVSLSGVFSDADNDSLTITAASGDEAVATVTVASDYDSLTVSATARGNATITVTASDGRGGTVSDAFTVTVKAAPVVTSALSDVSGLEIFAAREISLSGVFSDADGDSLTLSAASSDEFVVDAALVDEALTIFALDQGTATITVTAQDPDGNTVSDSFDVSVVGPPTPVMNLRCVAETSRVAFLWDAPEWSGGETYAYDYQLTLPGGKSEGGRIINSTLLLRTGNYQAGSEASVSVEAVYELPDGSNVSSAAETLTCTVAE